MWRQKFLITRYPCNLKENSTQLTIIKFSLSINNKVSYNNNTNNDDKSAGLI
jgi:hypothetical protein